MSDLHSPAPTSSPSMVRGIVALVLVLVGNIATTVLAVRLDWGLAYGPYVCLGLLAAQVGLVGAWWGLGPGPFWLRTCGAWTLTLIVSMLVMRWIVILADDLEFGLLFGGCSLLQFLLVFCMGMAVRSVRGPLVWGGVDVKPTRPQYSIRHLLLWMIGVSVVLGVGRACVALVQFEDSGLRFGWANILSIVAVYTATAGVASLLAWAMFQATWLRRCLSVAGAGVGVALISALEIAVVYWLQQAEESVGFSLMNSAQALWLLLAFGIAVLGGVRHGSGKQALAGSANREEAAAKRTAGESPESS